MSLADLMKRRIHHRDEAVMTVTPATPATLEGETGATVATVATVTVTERRRLWTVRHPEGWIGHAFTPPITEAEVRDRYPAALEVEVEEEPGRESLGEEDVLLVARWLDSINETDVRVREEVTTPETVATLKAGAWPLAIALCVALPLMAHPPVDVPAHHHHEVHLR